MYIVFLCIHLLIYSYEGIRSPGASDGKNIFKYFLICFSSFLKVYELSQSVTTKFLGERKHFMCEREVSLGNAKSFRSYRKDSCGKATFLGEQKSIKIYIFSPITMPSNITCTYKTYSVAQTVKYGTSNTKGIGSVPSECIY